MLRHALSVIVLCALPGAAQAQDGGTRSVFAQGAGIRAQAMGGAFTAISDDASAPLWNPGGLGFVLRREIQISHTTMYGLDITEDHAAAVLPSWRWGATALSFRRFGVSGIEGRDDRNLVTDPDISDGETELGVAYGRRFGAGWGLGGSMKYRRQSIGDVSASALGGDLGLVLRPGVAAGSSAAWLRRLSLGASMINAMEPSLRLDRDAVQDPATLRIGAAYEQPMGPGRTLLAAIDLERSRDMDPRFHAGFEVRLHPLLALRGGASNGVLTAGTGVCWRDLAVDYAMEDAELGVVHRLGVSLTFGATTEENHLAHVRRQEEALQARLEEAYARRQQERVGELLSGAEKARASGRWDEGLEFLAAVSALDPDNTAAAQLAASCWRDRAGMMEARGEFTEAALAYESALRSVPGDEEASQGAARCRAESDRRAARSAEIQARFSAALDAFGTGDLVAARNGFTSILASAPEDADAQAMLDRTTDAIHQRMQDLIDQADRFTRAGLFDEAVKATEAGKALDPGNVLLASAERELTRARARTTTASASSGSAPKPPAKATSSAASPAETALSPARRKEIEDLYRQGMEAARTGRGDDALRYWELVFAAAPGHEMVRDNLKREYVMRGMDAFAAGQLEQAVSYWERALIVDPGDRKTIGYLARARQQMDRTREILRGAR
jgi:tetratricopeptide (TPR) repeat protein